MSTLGRYPSLLARPAWAAAGMSSRAPVLGSANMTAHQAPVHYWSRNFAQLNNNSALKRLSHEPTKARTIVSYVPIQSTIHHPLFTPPPPPPDAPKSGNFNSAFMASVVGVCTAMASLCVLSTTTSAQAATTTSSAGDIMSMFSSPQAATHEETVDAVPNIETVTEPKQYETSVCPLKGIRPYMEDTYCIANGGRFAAVYDGHGGAGVSTYLRERLFSLLCQHLGQKKLEQGGAGDPHSLPVASHKEAIKMAFDQVDKEVHDDETLADQGSTAVAVVMHQDEDGQRTLISANVGDSRAVLCRNGEAVDLTRDHKACDQQERARLEAMGEDVVWDELAELYRVRSLSVSRSIGDQYAGPAVKGEAEIKQFPVAEGDEFILLASDGLWDVMSSQQVVSFVKTRMKSGTFSFGSKDWIKKRRQKMSRYVANEAMRKGSADNVCVLVVWLN